MLTRSLMPERRIEFEDLLVQHQEDFEMLRDYRCERYATRLRELARCIHVQDCVEDRVISQLASDYADRTWPTAGERFAKSEPGELTASAGVPAPRSVWEEDAALLKGLLKQLHMQPTLAMAMNLYTASLCRHAGMSACEESAVAQRSALPAGKTLGDLLVLFLYSNDDPLMETAEAEA